MTSDWIGWTETANITPDQWQRLAERFNKRKGNTMAKKKAPFPFEKSKYDKEKPGAPEGSKADMALDKRQKAAAPFQFNKGGSVPGGKGGQKSFRR